MLGFQNWILEDVEILKQPIEAKGKLGIWEYNIEKIAII